MSNSPLVTYTKISPNKNSPRKHIIDTVTIHCYVGQVTAERGCKGFASADRRASANYVVGYDGSIGMSVEEQDRSWCSSNGDNDNRAITIEVASSATHPYAVTDAAYKALIDLLVDICQRNPGIGQLKWKADKSLIGQPEKQNMTVHRWFANKACPGEWLYSRHSQIAAEVNARLNVGGVTEPDSAEDNKPVDEEKQPEAAATTFKKGDLVSLSADAKYYNGSDVANWVRKKNWYLKADPTGDRVVLGKSEDGKNCINSPVNVKYLKLVKAKPDVPFSAYVSVDDLNIRKGPGTNYDKCGVTGVGVFTIVEIQNGVGSNAGWGLLKAYQKNRNGWISLDYCKKV